MKNSAFRLFGVALLVATYVGCQTAGNFFRDSVDVMATPVLWLAKSDRPNNPDSTFNSNTWTSNQWGPKK